MGDSWKQDDECPYCRDPFEIVQVKFRFDGILFVSACPNCGLISISRATRITSSSSFSARLHGLLERTSPAGTEKMLHFRWLDRFPQSRFDHSIFR
jgi:hypothetical protein